MVVASYIRRPDPPARSPMVQGLADFSVEELQRTFKRAARPHSDSNSGNNFANVLLTVRILPYVLPVVDSLFDDLGTICWHILHRSSNMGVLDSNGQYYDQLLHILWIEREQGEASELEPEKV